MVTQRIPHGDYAILVSDDGYIVDGTVRDSFACLVTAIGIAMLLIGWGLADDIIVAIGFVTVFPGPLWVLMFVEPKRLAAYDVGTDYPGIEYLTSRIIPNDKAETTRLLCAAISRMKDAIDNDIKSDEDRISALKRIISDCK